LTLRIPNIIRKQAYAAAAMMRRFATTGLRRAIFAITRTATWPGAFARLPSQRSSAYTPHPRNVVHATVTTAKKPKIEAVIILLRIARSTLNSWEKQPTPSRLHAGNGYYVGISAAWVSIGGRRLREINWLCCKYVSRPIGFNRPPISTE
jgi:hypothetical protein